jgi:hypothetical protein
VAERVRLPKWLWLGFPPLLVLIVFATKLGAPAFYDQYIEGEQGLVELATPVVALCGLLVGLSLLRSLHQITLSCFYLAGEELSWGQQLFQWDTPQAIDQLNDQHETNLHNMSSWFDQKPRLLLELWVLIGGIIVPLRQRWSPAKHTKVFWKWFWPTLECVPSAVLAIAISLPERYRKIVGPDSLPFEIRWSEPQEYYFALFLLIYLLAMRARLRARAG